MAIQIAIDSLKSIFATSIAALASVGALGAYNSTLIVQESVFYIAVLCIISASASLITLAVAAVQLHSGNDPLDGMLSRVLIALCIILLLLSLFQIVGSLKV